MCLSCSATADTGWLAPPRINKKDRRSVSMQAETTRGLEKISRKEKNAPLPPGGKGRMGRSIDNEEIGLLDVVIFDEITKNEVCRQ